MSPFSLPPELLYPIFTNLPTHTLLTLAHTSHLTQHPSESLIYRNVSLTGKRKVRDFCQVVAECKGARLGPLVRKLELLRGGDVLTRNKDDTYEEWEEFWTVVKDALSTMSSLQDLQIEIGRDEILGWVLPSPSRHPSTSLPTRTPGFHLKSLKCGFALDQDLLSFLATQDTLEELSWTGNPRYVCYPSEEEPERTKSSISETSITSSYTETEHEPGIMTAISSTTTTKPKSCSPICPITTYIHNYLPANSLPNLHTLHSESLPLARVLTPNRPIKRLWVPSTDITSKSSTVVRTRVPYVYEHVSVGTWGTPTNSHTHAYNEERNGSRRRRRLPRVLDSPKQQTDSQTASQLICALQDFALSTGPLLSLRMCLELVSSAALCDVVSCIARVLPDLRTLGFIPGFDTEPTPPPFLTPLSTLTNLHTLILWSTISPTSLSNLAHACPSLRLVACLHFSPACEYLCLPVNMDGREGEGGILGCGKRYGGDEDKKEMVRRRVQGRPFALHDPQNRLWKDV